jgi:hypothetical protein
MRLVSYASLHSPFFFPGLGNMDKTLSDKSNPGIKMHLTGEGLEVRYKGLDFFIPTPNIVGVVFAKVDLSKASA